MSIFEAPDLTPLESQIVDAIEQIREQLSYAIKATRWTGLLRKVAFARAIRGSNSIEGYNVTVEDAMAAADGAEPSEADPKTWEAIVGYRDAMTYVLRLADDPHFKFEPSLIRSLHYMMLREELEKHPGQWRPGPIYVRDDDRGGEIVYEGPDAVQVPTLMSELVNELNEGGGSPAEHGLVRAAMAHLNLVMIHPFSDGNGRMARCLQTLTLAREGILAPQFCSIEEYLGAHTRNYYDVLAKVGAGRWNPQRETRPWIQFILNAHFQQATTLLRRSREIARLWEIVERAIEERHLPDRAVPGLMNAALGYRIRNQTYRSAADVPENQASHDLTLLVKEGLLVAHGERRGRYYEGSDILRQWREMAREPKEHVNPFQAVLGIPSDS